MAEGGVAAALANVDPEDGWQTALQRHHEWWQTFEQLAHGSTARPGSTGAGERVGALGRGISTAPKTVRFCNALLAATPGSVSATSVTEPVWK